VGQALATVFSKLGWMGTITLNYSGTQVVHTILLVLGIVVVSALVPAMMAARVASPSRETGWKLPKPKGDTIADVLPFTVTREAASGVLAFLHEYMDAHEGSAGHFTSDAIQYIAPEEGRHLGGVASTVWVSPYDLGVRQDVRITVRQAEGDVCDLHLELHRRSGSEKNWCKLNKTFVGDLRRQILGWRNVSSDRVLGYISEGTKHLGSEPEI
jgi:hypothetical protein